MPRFKDLGIPAEAAYRLPDEQKDKQSHDDEHELLCVEAIVGGGQDGQDDCDGEAHDDARALGQQEVMVVVDAVQHAVEPQAEEADGQAAAEQPALAVLELVDLCADGADVAADEEGGGQREVQDEEAEGGPGGAADGVGGLDAAVAAGVDPVEAEGDDEGADGLDVARGEAYAGGGADDDGVDELAEDDDEEGGHAVDLVGDVDGGAVLEAQAALEKGAHGERPGELVVEDDGDDDADLGADADAGEEQRHGQQQAGEHEGGHDAGLGAVLVAGEGDEGEGAQGGQARDHVGGGGGAQGGQAHVDGAGVVGVQHQQRHDPQDGGALRQVVGVVRVHELAQVRPHVPGGREDEEVLDQVGAIGVLGEVVAEAGDDGDVWEGCQSVFS